MLCWYVREESHMLRYDSIKLYDGLTFVEKQVSSKIHSLFFFSSRDIYVVKVHWRYRVVGEAL